MDSVNNKYYVKLSAITPLSVGTGNTAEWVKGADFVIDDGKVYVLDLPKIVAAGIDPSSLSTLFLSGDHNGIVRLLGRTLSDVSSRIFELPCFSTNNIKTFERSQFHDLPVVAGSSLKGALRSALFNYLRDSEEKNEEVFGKMQDGTDFMRFIKVGDFEMNDTRLYNSKIFNLWLDEDIWKGGWKFANSNEKKGIGGTTNAYSPVAFNTLFECVEPGDCGYGTIMFSPTQFQSLLDHCKDVGAHIEKKKQVIEGNLHALFAVVNNYTKAYLLKERHFFEQYPAERTEEIVESIDHLLSVFPSDNSSCIFKMSAGVGFHSITGDWRFEDYTETGFKNGKKRFKSRKIVDTGAGLSLMGFVRISEVDEAEYTNYRNQIDASFNERMKSIHEQKAAVKAKREEERLAQIEKENTYAELIAKAQLAESACNYLMVIELAKQAAELYPNKAEAQDLISRNQKKATDQALEQQQAAAQAKADADKEKKAQGGLAALLNETYEQGPNAGKFKVVDFKVCLQKVSSWMKAANVQSLPEDQKRVLTEVIYRLLSNPVKVESKDLGKREGNIWKKVETLLSASQADELYNNYISK